MNLMMINLATVLIGTGIAAYYDYKKGIVPEFISYPMIAIGAILAPFIFQDLIYVYGVAAAVFAIGFLLYSFGQLGGGDVFLFTAISLLVPFYPETISKAIQSIGINPVLPVYPFIGSVFVVAGLIGPMFIIALKYHFRIREKKGEIDGYKGKYRKGGLLAAVMLILSGFWLFLSPGFLFLFIPMAVTFSLLPFKNDLLHLFHCRTTPISSLNDDDILALEEIDEEKKEALGLWRKTFTLPEIKKIKEKAEEEGYEEVKVYEDLPKFVPYIFISLVLNLVFGDVFLYLVALTFI